MTSSKSSFYRNYAFISVLILVLAGSVGVLLRFGLVYGIPAGWGAFGNIIHAHSHTMFGWTILALMTIIWYRLPGYTGRPLPKGVRWQMAATALFSLSQLAAFWPNGYGPTHIGSADLPLGAMSAGFAGLTWFWFMGLYWRATRDLEHPPLALRLWRWAIVLLFVASLGAMAEPALLAMKIDNDFVKHLFLHLFLDLFTSGWLLLATLGAVVAYLEDKQALVGELPVKLLALFIFPTFLLGMPPESLSPALFWLAALSNLIAMGMLARYLYHLWPYWPQLPRLVRFSMAGLLVQIGAAALMLAPGLWAWGAGALRIFYLHNMLLLWTSSALLGLLMVEFGRALSAWRRWVENIWMTGVGVMWLALLLGGFVAWLPLSGRTLLAVAAWASVVIVTAAIMALRMFRK